MDSETLKVEIIYMSIGVCYKEASHYPSDHLSIMLYFAGLLTHLARQDDSISAELICWLTEKQVFFLSEHLIPLSQNLLKESLCISENTVKSTDALNY